MHALVYVGAATPLVLAALIAWIVWRSAGKERSRRHLREQLASPDPSVRRQVLESVDEHQLAKNASAFCELLESERDPSVLDALASAIARSRWEPTDDGNIVELRRWVAGRHAHPRVAADTSRGTDETLTPPAELDTSQIAATTPSTAEHVLSPASSTGPPASQTTSDEATRALVSQSTTTLEPMGANELRNLAPKIRELLGENLARMELVSIDGEVVATWAAADAEEDESRDREDVQHSTW